MASLIWGGKHQKIIEISNLFIKNYEWSWIHSTKTAKKRIIFLGKSSIFLENWLKKYSKIEFTYVVKNLAFQNRVLFQKWVFHKRVLLLILPFLCICRNFASQVAPPIVPKMQPQLRSSLQMQIFFGTIVHCLITTRTLWDEILW